MIADSYRPASKIKIEHLQPAEPVLAIVPFIREGDQIVGKILQLFTRAMGIKSRLFPGKALISEKIQQLKESKAQAVLLSATDTGSTTAVGQMPESIHRALPQAVILVGLWSLPDSGSAHLMTQIRESAASDVHTNLNEAVQGIVSHLSSPAREESSVDPVQRTKHF